MYENEYEHMTLKDWLITMLICCVPCVNIVMIFVWAFGSNVNPSKKTFFQACLIFWAIAVVLEIMLIFLIMAGTASGSSAYRAAYNMIGLF